jgi:hypothetical protein
LVKLGDCFMSLTNLLKVISIWITGCLTVELKNNRSVSGSWM